MPHLAFAACGQFFVCHLRQTSVALAQNIILLPMNGVAFQKIRCLPASNASSSLKTAVASQTIVRQFPMNGIVSTQIDHPIAISSVVSCRIDHPFQKSSSTSQKYVRLFQSNDITPAKNIGVIPQIAVTSIPYAVLFDSNQRLYITLNRPQIGNTTSLSPIANRSEHCVTTSAITLAICY